jgi:hypothetical protein
MFVALAKASSFYIFDHIQKRILERRPAILFSFCSILELLLYPRLKYEKFGQYLEKHKPFKQLLFSNCSEFAPSA